MTVTQDPMRQKAVATSDAPGGRFDGRRTVAPLDLRPGRRVSNVGCGPGPSGLPAGAVGGAEGQVAGLDRAETFDAVVGVFSISFVADIEHRADALRHMVRPGGIPAITVWGPCAFEPAAASLGAQVQGPRHDIPVAARPRERPERRLAAILFADVAGYTALMGADEAGTLRRLTDLRRAFLEPLIDDHRGRIVKLMGDGLLVEFASVVDAVACALAWQEGVADRDEGLRFRIGINLGDVIVEGDDIHGDGVNIAARLEGLAEPGGICLSGDAYRQARGKVEAAFQDRGKRTLKNVAEPVRVYRASLDGPAAQREPRLRTPAKRSLLRTLVAVGLALLFSVGFDRAVADVSCHRPVTGPPHPGLLHRGR